MNSFIHTMIPVPDLGKWTPVRNHPELSDNGIINYDRVRFFQPVLDIRIAIWLQLRTNTDAPFDRSIPARDSAPDSLGGNLFH